MKYKLLIVSIFLFSNGSSEFADDLKKIVGHHGCDKKCIFNYSEVTSKTIQFLPKKCDTVCAILTFNSNTDLTESQLREGLKTMKYLTGSLKIENSTLKTLNIFANDKYGGDVSFYCEGGEISIKNNSMLEDVSIFQDIYVWGDDFTRECPVRMENNPKLDTTEVCEMGSFREWIGIRTSGNLKDCGCYGGLITSSESLRTFENCTTLYGGLKFLNFSASDDLKFLSNLEDIRGNLEIQNTNFKDLSFLRNLKKLQSMKPLDGKNIAINIRKNPEMTTLGFESLEDLFDAQSDETTVNLENLHPELCLSFKEVYVFLYMHIKLKNAQAKYCQNSEKVNRNDLNVCEFKNFDSLGDNCEFIFGDILIDSYDGKFLWKLYGVRVIFGSLKIQYTKLDALSFLQNLMFIANLNDTNPAVLIRSNKYLKQAKFPYLEHVISRSGKYVEVYDNPVLFENNQECLMYRITYKTNVRVKNEDCDRNAYSMPSNYQDSPRKVIILIIGISFLKKLSE